MSLTVDRHDLPWPVCVLRKRKKAESEGVNLKVRWRAKVAMRDRSEESARRAILVWECRDRPPRRSLVEIFFENQGEKKKEGESSPVTLD